MPLAPLVLIIVGLIIVLSKPFGFLGAGWGDLANGLVGLVGLYGGGIAAVFAILKQARAKQARAKQARAKKDQGSA